MQWFFRIKLWSWCFIGFILELLDLWSVQSNLGAQELTLIVESLLQAYEIERLQMSWALHGVLRYQGQVLHVRFWILHISPCHDIFFTFVVPYAGNRCIVTLVLDFNGLNFIFGGLGQEVVPCSLVALDLLFHLVECINHPLFGLNHIVFESGFTVIDGAWLLIEIGLECFDLLFELLDNVLHTVKIRKFDREVIFALSCVRYLHLQNFNALRLLDLVA